MSNLISDSRFIQAVALRMCVGFAFIGSAVTAHAAQSEEGLFAPDLEVLSIQPARSGADWLLPYQFGASVVLARSPDTATAPIGSGFGSAAQSSPAVKPQQATAREINSRWPQTYDGERVALPQLLRVEFKVEQFKVSFRPQSALIEGEQFKIRLQPHSAMMLWGKAF